MPVVGDGDIADRVADFLTANQGAFEIGVEPVQAYLARTGAAEPPADVLAQVSRLQRVYQLTPDDASMAVLLRHNLDSAFAITRYDAAGFIRAFAGQARRRRYRGGDPRPRQADLRLDAEHRRRLPERPGAPRPRRVMPSHGSTTAGTGVSGHRVPDARGPVRVAGLLPLLGLQLDPQPGGLPGRSAELPRPAAPAGHQPAGRLARPPSRPAVPAVDVREHQHRAAVHRPGQRDARVLRGQRALDRRLSGPRHRRRITSAELLASPQYVDDAAYASLQATPSSRRRCRSTGRSSCCGCT